jgi:hypothetical protein
VELRLARSVTDLAAYGRLDPVLRRQADAAEPGPSRKLVMMRWLIRTDEVLGGLLTPQQLAMRFTRTSATSCRWPSAWPPSTTSTTSARTPQ